MKEYQSRVVGALDDAGDDSLGAEDRPSHPTIRAWAGCNCLAANGTGASASSSSEPGPSDAPIARSHEVACISKDFRGCTTSFVKTQDPSGLTTRTVRLSLSPKPIERNDCPSANPVAQNKAMAAREQKWSR